jgi:ATP-dependent helicase/nuclease subunit B
MPCRLLISLDHRALLAEARAFVHQHSASGPVLLVAHTRTAADEVVRVASGAGLLGVHRLTMTALAAVVARPVLAENNLAPLSRLGSQALMARVVDSLARANRLHHFQAVAGTPGFAGAAAATISEMRMNGISPNALTGGGPAADDLAAILEAYNRQLDQQHLADLATVYTCAAAELAAGQTVFSGMPAVLLDVDVASSIQESLLAALTSHAPAILALAHAAELAAIERLSRVAQVPAGQASAAIPHVPAALAAVRTGLFAQASGTPVPGHGVRVFSAASDALECVEIARALRAEALQNGRRYDEMAVLLRDPDRYAAPLEEALRRAGIPAWFSRGSRRPNPTGRAFLALLDCALDRCSASRFAEYLSFGQVPHAGNAAPAADAAPTPPADEMLAAFLSAGDAAAVSEADPSAHQPPTGLRAPARCERLLVDAAVVGGADRWDRRLRGLEAQLRLERDRRATDGDDNSCDGARAAAIERRLALLTGLREFALPLIRLLDGLPQAATWGEWIDALGQIARAALHLPGDVLAVLEELRQMSTVGPLPLAEVRSVLAAHLGSLRAAPAANRYGCVFVGSLAEARGCAFACVFVPGLSEGAFPKRALEDPLLADRIRRALNLGLDEKDARVARERLLLRRAAAAAGECLTVSYPRMDAVEGRPRVPSFYALEVVRAAEGRLPGLRQFESASRSRSTAQLGWPAPLDAGEALDNAEYDLARLHQCLYRTPPERLRASGRYLLEQGNHHLARALRARWRRWNSKWSSDDGLVHPDLATAPLLAGHRLNARAYSPSALERYARCPYQFLLAAIHNLRPAARPEPVEHMDAMVRGELYHAAQFELMRALRDASLLPITAANATSAEAVAEATLDRVAADFAERLAPAIPRVWQAGVAALRADLRGWIRETAACGTVWAPQHTEFGFGLPPRPDIARDPASTAEEARVFPAGYRLRGSIDLVERNEATGLLRVTDYKTGKAPEPRPAEVGKGEVLQPLLYALAAETLLNRPVHCGRLSYATRRGGYANHDIPLNEHTRARIHEVLVTIDNAIADGFLPAAPVDGACDQCDYHPVCGPYEQRRSARKAKEAIEPLIALRRMP